mgnify:CR=1 FL=1
MFEDLDEKEFSVLKEYVEYVKNKDYPLNKQLEVLDLNEDITLSLYSKGYIHLKVSTGIKGDIVFQYNYQINGSLLSDEVLEYFNIKNR